MKLSIIIVAAISLLQLMHDVYCVMHDDMQHSVEMSYAVAALPFICFVLISYAVQRILRD